MHKAAERFQEGRKFINNYDKISYKRYRIILSSRDKSRDGDTSKMAFYLISPQNCYAVLKICSLCLDYWLDNLNL